MSNEHKLCMSCMNVVPAGASACPKCGYNGTQRNPALCLPIGYRLANRYVVGRKLNDNGDSVRYVAYDCVEKAVVELCEFLPRNGCMRGPDDFVLHPKYGAELHYKTALVDFCELYRNLRKLKNERSLVNTLDFLEANGTAYAVLERFENGVTLKEFLSLSGGTIAFEKCMTLLSPVLDAIDAIHSVNLIHRGVSPDTIYVNRNGDVKLGGFATSSVRTKDTEVAAKMQSGYSAPEQYSTTSWQNTQTDVYGIAATFYRCLTGTTPQDAEQRKSYDTLEAPIALNNAIPQYASRAIMLAMLVNMNERTRTAKDFKDMFNDRFADDSTREMEPRMIAVSTAKTKKTAIKAKPKNSKNRNRDVNEEQEKDGRGIRIAIVIVAVLAVLIGMFFVGKELLAEFDTQPDVIPVPTLTIPDYTNKKLAEIMYDRDNFKYEYEYVAQNSVEDNVIVSQKPDAGAVAKNGDTIILYVNKSEKSTKMIEVVGYSQANAEAKLKEAGIKYVVAKEKTDMFAAGIIFKQSIQKGVGINPETQTVTITVAVSAFDGATIDGETPPPA